MPQHLLDDVRRAAQLSINQKPVNPRLPFRLYVTGAHAKIASGTRQDHAAVVYEFAKPHDAAVWFSGMPFASYEYAALFGPGFPPMPDWERIGGGWE